MSLMNKLNKRGAICDPRETIEVILKQLKQKFLYLKYYFLSDIKQINYE